MQNGWYHIGTGNSRWWRATHWVGKTGNRLVLRIDYYNKGTGHSTRKMYYFEQRRRFAPYRPYRNMR